MAWQRGGDTGSSYPALMATAADRGADERTINEVGGFVWRLSMLSGAHLTDYVLDLGTVTMIGGGRTKQLLAHCTRHGLLTKVKTSHGIGYRLIDDPDFIHLRSKADVLRSRQQLNDTRNLALTVPVRLRDGDQCRWCGVEVQWMGKKTNRSAQYDHLHPERLGNQETTVDDLVVSCAGCNQGRGGNVEQWDSSHRLLVRPRNPLYGNSTATFLTRNGYPTEPYSEERDSDVRPAPALGADTAPHQGVRPATGLSDDPAPQARPEADVVRKSDRSEFGGPSAGYGSGRVGAGVVGQGRDGTGGDGAGRRRGRRGRRSAQGLGGEPR